VRAARRRSKSLIFCSAVCPQVDEATHRGTAHGEWRGIVDVLAIRKDTSKPIHDVLKSGDLFDIVLVQMKGGSARMPSSLEIDRLRAVAKRYRAKDIVLFAWKRDEHCKWHRLTRGNRWTEATAAQIFG
jgi:hypothetical protein